MSRCPGRQSLRGLLVPAVSEASPTLDFQPQGSKQLCSRWRKSLWGAAFSGAHLDVRSSFCSSRGWEAEAWDSRSRFCSRSMEDCLCWSFLWVAVSFWECEVGGQLWGCAGDSAPGRPPRAGAQGPKLQAAPWGTPSAGAETPVSVFTIGETEARGGAGRRAGRTGGPAPCALTPASLPCQRAAGPAPPPVLAMTARVLKIRPQRPRGVAGSLRSQGSSRQALGSDCPALLDALSWQEPGGGCLSRPELARIHRPL